MMKTFWIMLCLSVFCVPARAVPLLFDNFSGPVANATGQLPTMGGFPWICSGAGASTCVRGGGQMKSTASAGSVYYLMHTASTPMTISYQFTDAVEAPALVIAITRDGTLSNMWHANGYNSGSSFVFSQTYWCDTAVGCAASTANTSPLAQGTNDGPCPATVSNHSYIGSLSFYSDTAVATLKDAATGAVLCSNTASDPKLQSVIGPNFYLEGYYVSPNLVFTSVSADSVAPGRPVSQLISSTAPKNVKTVATALDAAVTSNSIAFAAVAGLQPSQLPDALGQLSGEIASISAGAAISASSSFMTLLINPANWAPSPTQGRASREYLTGRSSGPEFAVWIGGYGQSDNLDADPTSGGHKEQERDAGVALGFDYRPSRSFAVGLVVGETRLDWNLHDLISSGHADATQVGAYISQRGDLAYIELGLTYSNLGMKTVRIVTAVGTSQYTGGFTGTDFGGRGEMGLKLLGENSDHEMIAFSAVEDQRFTAPAYSEVTVSGSPVYALAIGSPDKNQVLSDVGVKINLWPNASIGVHGLLAWRHMFSRDQTATAAFAGNPSWLFRVAGTPMDKDIVAGSLGSEIGLTRSLLAGLAITGTAGQKIAGYGGSLFLRQVF